MLFPDNVLLAGILNLNDESQLRVMIQVITIILCVLFFYNNLNANTEKGKKRNNYESISGNSEFADNKYDSYSLDQNSPNPFFDSTTIRYSLPVKSKVNLEIYNDKAETVGILVDEIQDAGNYIASFYAELEGVKLPAGIYYYRLKISEPGNIKKNEFVDVKRMVIIE